MTCPHLTTLSAFVRDLAEVKIHFTPAERAVMLARAEAEISRIVPILAERGYTCRDGVWGYHERLLRMPNATDLIQ